MQLDKFKSKIPFLIDTEDSEEVNYHWEVRKAFFEDAYWNFVTESFFEDYMSLTEKTFKPIANLQPFLIFGSPLSLRQLHKLGYKTFDGYIDESYDIIEDPNQRMRALCKEAFKLADMTDADHVKLMTAIKPILEHNQKLFFNKTWKEFL
jgi:hypothetical protein